MKRVILLLVSCLVLTSSIAVATNHKFHPGSGGATRSVIFNKILFGNSMPTEVKATKHKQFIFSPRKHMWGVYDANGSLVKQGLANGGGFYCQDVKRGCHTPKGSYRIYHKGNATCKSSSYPIKKINGKTVRGGAAMPYCMFFRGGYAIHGSTGLVDGNVSHGCIRVNNEAARWLQKYLPIGATVKILPY